MGEKESESELELDEEEVVEEEFEEEAAEEVEEALHSVGVHASAVVTVSSRPPTWILNIFSSRSRTWKGPL